MRSVVRNSGRGPDSSAAGANPEARARDVSGSGPLAAASQSNPRIPDRMPRVTRPMTADRRSTATMVSASQDEGAGGPYRHDTGRSRNGMRYSGRSGEIAFDGSTGGTTRCPTVILTSPSRGSCGPCAELARHQELSDEVARMTGWTAPSRPIEPPQLDHLVRSRARGDQGRGGGGVPPTPTRAHRRAPPGGCPRRPDDARAAHGRARLGPGPARLILRAGPP